MVYVQLLGIVLIFWVLNFIITLVFRNYTKGTVQEYEQKLINNGNNIFTYGLVCVGGIFVGNLFGGWLSYIIIGLGGLIVLLGLPTLLLMFIATIPLTFNSEHHGIGGTGKLSDWIFFASSLAENALMVFLVFRMYTDFFQ